MKAVFLDKDGTLIEDVPYNVRREWIRLMPGAARGLRTLHAAGYALFVISNQPGVAFNYFSESALDAVSAELARLLKDAGATLTGFYYCPHHPAGRVPAYTRSCECRKPGAALLRRAAVEHGVTLAASWFIGDILDDVEAGRRAGCRTVLLDNGHETEWRTGPLRRPHFIVPDLPTAANIITRQPAAPARLASVPTGVRQAAS